MMSEYSFESKYNNFRQTLLYLYSTTQNITFQKKKNYEWDSHHVIKPQI